MVSPIDYTIDVQSPFQAAMQGWAAGTQDKLARADETRRQQLFDQQQAAMQKQQLQQQQFATDRAEFAAKPNKTTQDFVDFQIKYPEVTEPYKKTWEMKSEGEQRLALGTAGRVMAAIKTGNPKIAQDILEEQAVAQENKGDKEGAFNSRRVKGLITKDPNSVYATLGEFANAVSPDEFPEMMVKMGSNARDDQLQPIAINQANANVSKTTAETAKTEAETNDIPLAADDRRAGVENQARKNEYDNQYNYDKLSQDQRLFLADLNQKDKIEANKLRASKAETSIQRVERLEKVENYANAAKQAAEGSTLAAKLAGQVGENGGAYWDRVVRQVPGTSENTFAKDIETLKSQVFLTQIEKMRGLGALTDKEGDAIRSSIASLDINQGPKAVQQNLTKIAQQLSLAAQSANHKAQLYATRGYGYPPAVVDAAKQRGVSPAEMQKIANELGIQ